MSRRDALRRFGGVMVGGAAGAAVIADPAGAASGKCAKGLTTCCNQTCGTVCVDAKTDIHNCGGCGNVCSPPANSNATCTNGTCGFTCNTGYSTCSGACVDTTSDPNNCGTCGTVCTSGVCSNSTCATTMLPNGSTCTSGTQCSSGNCVPDNTNTATSVCCATSCTARPPDTCGENGNALHDGSGCAFYPAGAGCSCPGGTTVGTCNGSGICSGC